MAGRVWSIALTSHARRSRPQANLVEHTAELGASALGNVSGFGVDASGELYVINYSAGSIRRLSRGAIAADQPADNPLSACRERSRQIPTPNSQLPK